MALKEAFMLKTVIGDADLELSADAGESILVKDVQIYGAASNYVTLTIDKVTVGYFRVGGTLGSHLPYPRAVSHHSHNMYVGAGVDVTTLKGCPIYDAGLVSTGFDLVHDGDVAASVIHKPVLANWTTNPRKTILGLLSELGIFKGYPVAEGETFKITGAAKSGAVQIVIYELHDAGDITPDMENGTESPVYTFINYGNAGAAINVDGDTLLDTCQSPAQFPDFPFGKVVDPKKKITIHGILASDFAPKENDGTNYCITKYLKLIQARKTLFDEDMNGILLYAFNTTTYGDVDYIGEGVSLIGNFSDMDLRPPLIFPKPLVFGPGEELNIYLNTEKAGTGQDIATDEHEVGLIERVEPAEG